MIVESARSTKVLMFTNFREVAEKLAFDQAGNLKKFRATSSWSHGLMLVGLDILL